MELVFSKWYLLAKLFYREDLAWERKRSKEYILNQEQSPCFRLEMTQESNWNDKNSRNYFLVFRVHIYPYNLALFLA